ncbi:hypothetical protein GCM10027566_30320 [Arachidicoccus ginsenosidivorans]
MANCKVYFGDPVFDKTAGLSLRELKRRSAVFFAIYPINFWLKALKFDRNNEILIADKNKLG